ncbi:MAG: DUF3857 and transglutaminase domain-containing protein [Saprospiraceae bacterium]|nr:DUF3857 and transglutaminase domain-containing protein [Saprospiraceae bacterium]
MRTFFLTLLLTFVLLDAVAQPMYPASAIPPDLLRHANAVIRAHELVFEVKNKGEAIEREHKVVTILNEEAAHFGEPAFYYYEFIEIEDIEASVYDSAGKLVRNLKKKDIKDIKPLDYFINDIRYKVLDLPSRIYPYTVEYTVVKKYDGLMFYPDFTPQQSPTHAIESSSYSIIVPSGLNLRFWESNMPEGSKIGASTWRVNNIEAFKPPPYASKKAVKLPKVVAAPEAFTFGGVEGEMSTWESFGKFISKLNETQQGLPSEVEQKLVEMVKDCPDDFCKIDRIYDYLQSNTRYFYIGLGIGGWQPAAASKVDKHKYGDCKGLSNYMVAMLKAVGVPANYVLIRAGEKEFDAQNPEFPNPYFNHAIACVPLKDETLWLECTSQTESCGFLSDFTDNRMALVITSEGGKVMHTPIYDETKNVVKRVTEIKLSPDGNANLASRDNYACIMQDYMAHLEGLSDEERKKSLYELLNIKNFEVKSISLKRNKGRFPSVERQLELALPNFAAVNGKRFFVPISVLSQKLEVPVSEAEAPSFSGPTAVAIPRWTASPSTCPLASN